MSTETKMSQSLCQNTESEKHDKWPQAEKQFVFNENILNLCCWLQFVSLVCNLLLISLNPPSNPNPGPGPAAAEDNTSR